ncbi:anti-sigma factor domain-containing protein [Mesobacillus harenae]|uniref:anti-sigma factor domain-containing protein n=1 Tax=Mesobacillus harenae TaxID=2213203 RepID=UPI00158125B9|nr:anti-sigma factor domain-containing protein [Mesobacillus harenae]
MRKGIVLEVNDLYITLLTPDGEFMKAKNLNNQYAIGEEIDFFPLAGDQESQKGKGKYTFLAKFKLMAVSAAVVLLIASSTFFSMYESNEVYAYMSIDVNPSLEMGLNENTKVVSLEALNKDGELVLKELSSWKKKDAGDITEAILAEIKEQGFKNEAENVLVATALPANRNSTADEKLKKEMAEIKKSAAAEDLTVKVINGTNQDRKAAKKQGISTGLYKAKENQKVRPNPEKAKTTKELNKEADSVQNLQKEKQVHPRQKPSEVPGKSVKENKNQGGKQNKNTGQSNSNGNGKGNGKSDTKSGNSKTKDLKGNENNRNSHGKGNKAKENSAKKNPPKGHSNQKVR